MKLKVDPQIRVSLPEFAWNINPLLVLTVSVYILYITIVLNLKTVTFQTLQRASHLFLMGTERIMPSNYANEREQPCLSRYYLHNYIHSCYMNQYMKLRIAFVLSMGIRVAYYDFEGGRMAAVHRHPVVL